jgi:hypothetical protein
MPLDAGGKFRHNTQVAAMHSKGKDAKLSDKKDSKPLDDKGAEDGHEITEVHDHKDGSFHTEPDGEEHETIGHLHAHLSKLHGAAGEKHFHGHSDGISHHSHAVETGGEAEHRDHEDEHGIAEHLNEHIGGDGTPQEDGEEQEQNESALGGY